MSPSEGFGAYTDYGRLKSAIVGSAEGLSLPPFNPTLHHYNEEVQAALKANGDKPLDISTAMPARWEKTVEQLDSLAALYEANGIRVYRPRPYSEEVRHYFIPLIQFIRWASIILRSIFAAPIAEKKFSRCVKLLPRCFQMMRKRIM